MSQILSSILEGVRDEYKQRMVQDAALPFMTAERLCHEMLYLDTDRMAELVEEEPSLLASRASDLIADPKERGNPSVGAIIASNLVMVALENLLAVAVENDWLRLDEEGNVMVDEKELDPTRSYPMLADYSLSQQATSNLSKPGVGLLTARFRAAEESFLQKLETEAHDAYQLALEVSSSYSVFAPDDIAPLVKENPLLLGLRPDGLMDEELFSGDPPAGMIISGHLTNILLDQLLEVAEEHGALARDGVGHMIMPEGDEDSPVIH